MYNLSIHKSFNIIGEQPSKDVDEKANAYFQAIYNRGMSVDQLLDILKQFKDSQNRKEKVCLYNVFTSMLLGQSFVKWYMTNTVSL